MKDSKKLGLIAVGALLFMYFKKSQGVSLGWLQPVKGKITSPFGSRINPVTGVPEFHNGIDIGVPEGTPVQAPAPGIVSKVYYNSLGGNQIIIKHNNGYTTGYAHLSKTLVMPGESVTAGKIIALSGKTGLVTSAHLHFTLTDPSGKVIDPQPVFYP